MDTKVVEMKSDIPGYSITVNLRKQAQQNS